MIWYQCNTCINNTDECTNPRGCTHYIYSTAGVPPSRVWFWQKRVCFLDKNARERVRFLGREWITWRQFSKDFSTMSHFSAVSYRKGYYLTKFIRKKVCFPPKKCKRKGVFSANFARERVWVPRSHWHTRVQKLGKRPTGVQMPWISCSELMINLTFIIAVYVINSSLLFSPLVYCVFPVIS